ncbi:EAL domain-containing protein [Halalkalibacter urbisdiaboli]|uniref:EAL domain-containing protein n=1 Tax=Halalkalibacter urbisdiaboli TaxID=1960589 RepID=UPI000B43C388|nr:EAL domain-containing protein [Halalkalibacter urbisdiaboli]
MKYQMVTIQMVIKISIVLVIIAIFNFSMSHLLLKGKLTAFIDHELSEKVLLAEELVLSQGHFVNGQVILDGFDEVSIIPTYQVSEKINNVMATEHLLANNWTIYEDSTQPIRYYFKQLSGNNSLFLAVNIGQHQDIENRIIAVDIFVTLFTYGCFLFILFWIIGQQLRPLGEIERYLAEVSSGNLSKRLSFKRDKQFDWLAERINEMVEKIEQLVTKVKVKANKQIEYMAYHDHLTGLPNRRLFQETLNNEIKVSRTNNQKCFVFLVSINSYKSWVNSYGSTVADECLKVLADRIQDITPLRGCVSRYDSQEFSILLSDDKKKAISSFSQNLMKVCEKSLLINGEEISCSISVGCVSFPEGGEYHETLMRHASLALHTAKEKGKKEVVEYTEQLGLEKLEYTVIESRFKKALRDQKLTLFYQPQINILTGKVIGVEALLRWKDEELGFVSPSKFIPIIERTNLINDLGKWVIQEACKQLKEWEGAGLPELKMSINVSTKQFQDSNIVEVVEESLKQSGLMANQLMIELTEETAMEDVNESLTKMRQLREMGVELAIDDFGTGYSSLRYLTAFRVHSIKIDRGFMKELDQSEEGKEVVSAIIGLAKNLKLKVVAEGVESLQQLQFLKSKKCSLIQGYYFSKPLSANELENWVRNHQQLQYS